MGKVLRYGSHFDTHIDALQFSFIASLFSFARSLMIPCALDETIIGRRSLTTTLVQVYVNDSNARLC